jgi:sulfotransferase family protein
MVRPIQLMIAGAQKAGTTSLFRYLTQHPQLSTHPHREMSFFSHDLEYDQGYRRVFNKYFPEAGSGDRTIMAKDVMVFNTHQALERLHAHNPGMHIVVLLRHPVRRVYSAYWYARSRGWEPIKSFEKAIEAEPDRLAEDSFKWRYCAYLDTSTYDRHIDVLLKRFGKERVHVYLTEDLHENPQKICQGIYRILDLDPAFTPEVEKRHNESSMARSELFARMFSRFTGSTSRVKLFARTFFSSAMIYKVKHAMLALNDKKFRPPPMAEETKRRLIEYFKPHNTRLSELLGRELPLWDQ